MDEFSVDATQSNLYFDPTVESSRASGIYSNTYTGEVQQDRPSDCQLLQQHPFDSDLKTSVPDPSMKQEVKSEAT